MKTYAPYISGYINRKGVLDIDSVKGCSFGMATYPDGGCYGLCYACGIAKLYNYNFNNSISRKLLDVDNKQLRMFGDFDISGKKPVLNMVKKHKLDWFRIGTMGDPCHDWELTADICMWLFWIKTPVVITKHWVTIPDNLLNKFKTTNTVFNTSISALDTVQERHHRLAQFNRLKDAGIKSILRIVSCKFGNTKNGTKLNNIQNQLFKNNVTIDNPLRIPRSDSRVVCGDIITEKHKDLNKVTDISIAKASSYIGKCGNCPDQCGVL